MSAHEVPQPASCPPERFVVEVFSELNRETIQNRWGEINVVLRLSMLTGLQMQLDATLNMMCDMAAEITSFEKALIYFWDEATETFYMLYAYPKSEREDLTGQQLRVLSRLVHEEFG